jgi:hypothetical protein
MKVRKLIVGRGLIPALALAVLAFAGSMFSLTSSTTPAVAHHLNNLAKSNRGAPAAATACPPFNFVSNINLARNPSFETIGPNGLLTNWQQGDPIPSQSAARFWLMHTNDAGDTVRSRLVQTNVPGPGGSRMLHFRAGGNEGGIIQQLPSAPAKLMFSAWVYVRRGQVALQPNSGTTGPVAWSTKLNQWEQLRVCTDGTVPTGFFAIYNQDPQGGEFFVDRVEIRRTP